MYAQISAGFTPSIMCDVFLGSESTLSEANEIIAAPQ
jgi:hypothetical protein